MGSTPPSCGRPRRRAARATLRNLLLPSATAALLLAPPPADAAGRAPNEFNKDGILYLLDSDSETAAVGRLTEWNKLSLTIPQTIRANDGVTYTITSVGDEAFRGCGFLESIQLPATICSVGDWAFYECGGLKKIDIPGNVTQIGIRAFDSCEKLESIRIPESVERIGKWAFRDCGSLTHIDVAAGNAAYQSTADGMLLNKSGDTLIACPAGKTGVVAIGAGVTAIGEWCFDKCAGLTQVDMPGAVRSIGYQAFYDCAGLTHIDLPRSLKSIGESAFNFCSSLTSVELPPCVETLGEYAFGQCDELLTVTMPIDLRLGNVGWAPFIGDYKLRFIFTYCADVEPTPDEASALKELLDKPGVPHSFERRCEALRVVEAPGKGGRVGRKGRYDLLGRPVRVGRRGLYIEDGRLRRRR